VSVWLSFETSSAVLLGEVLRAAAADGKLSDVSLAFRTPGPAGRSATELVDTFTTAEVTSMTEQLSGTPMGSVSLLLPADAATSTPGTQQHTDRFAPLSAAPTTRAYVSLGRPLPAYPVAAVSLSQAAAGAPLDLTFTTSALPLLDTIYQAKGAAEAIPALTLAIGDRAGINLWRHTFPKLTVSVFAENLAGPSFSGTASLTGRPR
jgi:hypothetical protein